MKTLKLSLVDRSNLIELLPKTGSIEEVKKNKGFIQELTISEDERKIEENLSQIRDKSERDKAIDSYFREKNDFSISDDLFNVLKKCIEDKSNSNAVAVSDPIDAYEQFL